MLRSLFSAISGLRANQFMLDVTGNNIANANTAGYKSSGVVFQDTLSQMLTAGAVPTATTGGTNPIQVGLGVQVGATSTNFGQGASQVTGKQTNLAIQGDGFFVVNRNGENIYTRAGAFDFDSAGNLVTPDGDMVQGYPSDGQGGIDAAGAPTNITIAELATNNATTPLQSYNIGSDGTITGVYQDGTKVPLFQVAMANFSNPNGLDKIGDTSYRTSTNSGAPQVGVPGSGRLGRLAAGQIEMSNVDLASEFTNLIIAQRGFQATSRVITTSDQVLEELVNLKR